MCEILAPAGNENSALAAINAGTDAIYLGMNKFSARSSAGNFDVAAFEKICGYAHAFGVKVYAALNTVVKDNELTEFLTLASEVWNAGADALILQDLFLGKYIKQNAPQISLHLSTQAGVCNVYGAQLAKSAGFERVITARETKFEDIAEIAKIIETEVFVQGALCTCFSGQCYMSSFAGGNSGNRGKCKQPCRKKYSIDRADFDDAAYRLSLSDLCVGTNIKKLMEAGVYSFKIEGRMRRPEYVSAAVGYYKNILEGADGDISALKRTYNRGNYTGGLAFGQDKKFISSAVQGHIGEFAGIIKVVNGEYICQSVLKPGHGDGFKILRGGKEAGGGIYGKAVNGGFTVLTKDRLKNGDKVFITTDTELNGRLLAHQRSIPLKIDLDFSAGKPACTEINGRAFYGELPLEKAKTSSLTEEQLIRCFEKTDIYPFAPCFGTVKTDGVFVASSVLNAFRRKVYADYYREISECKNPSSSIRAYNENFPATENNKTAVICGNLNGLKADIGILKCDCPFDGVGTLTDNFDGEKFLYIPPYLTGVETEIFEKAACLFDGVYCDSYFGRKLAEKLGKKFFAGAGFNITNRLSLSVCKADYVCLSKELTRSEAEELSRENTFYLTAGNIKVMDLIYCPFEKKCASCDRRKIYTLTDENGRKFPLRRYEVTGCRFEVYNCADLVTDGCAAGRLLDCTLTDNAAEIAACRTRAELEKFYKNHTRGHYSNGIL